MTRPLSFTEASIRRAVNGARKAGLRVIGIRADGTVLVDEKRGAGLAPLAGDIQTPTAPPDNEAWGEAEA